MATYAISLSFTASAKNDEKAQELADQMVALVEAEGLAYDSSVIDIEQLDDADDGAEDPDELDFE